MEGDRSGIRLQKMPKREGANAKTMAKFYMAVMQAVLLYGSESWAITKRNWGRLESFQKRAVRRTLGKMGKVSGTAPIMNLWKGNVDFFRFKLTSRGGGGPHGSAQKKIEKKF